MGFSENGKGRAEPLSVPPGRALKIELALEGDLRQLSLPDKHGDPLYGRRNGIRPSALQNRPGIQVSPVHAGGQIHLPLPLLEETDVSGFAEVGASALPAT